MNDESVFLQQLRNGDRAAFRELVALYSKRVLNTCYRFVLEKEDAEDLSQEVFIEIYQSVKTFRGTSKLSTWIYSITVSKCLDHIRKRKRQKRITSLGRVLHLEEVAHWIAGGAMPDKNLQQKEKWKEIGEVLNTLPDNQRVAFTLSKIEGYSNPEIAEIMNTTVTAVESLIYRARKKISHDLEIILKK